MFDDEIKKRIFEQMNDFWVNPEIQRRREQGSISEDFKILRLLVKLPSNQPPIVEFNDEVGWQTNYELAPGEKVGIGEAVYLHQILRVKEAHPPTIDGQRVAFVFLFWTGYDYQLIFDFSPNVPVEFLSQKPESTWAYSELIAYYWQNVFIEKVTKSLQSDLDRLQNIGLWLAPSLLPYPLSKIAILLGNNEESKISETLTNYCTPNFLKELIQTWFEVEPFKLRQNLIETALEAHSESKYSLSIYALMPHLEGIVTQWLHTSGTVSGKKSQKSRTGLLIEEVIKNNPHVNLAFRHVIESSNNFIANGPVFSPFDPNNWSGQINILFPNRHVLLHGKYEEAFFTEENSIKVFLLLDTLCALMIANQVQSGNQHANQQSSI